MFYLNNNIQRSFEFANNNTSFLVEDFVCAENNKEAYKLVTRWTEFWDNNSLIITANKSAGKTHLAKIWQESSKAVFLSSERVKQTTIENLLCEIELSNVIVDDIDKLNDAESQEKLFHIFNKVVNSGKYILLTSSKPVFSLEFCFNDLKSRLCSALSVNVSEPNDDMMRIIFTKFFSDMQLRVAADVIEFLIPRVERNFSSAKKIVEKIDKKSIEMKRGVTIPFVKEVLSI